MITEMAFVATPVTDMKRARAFYEDILGLQSTEDFEGKWIEYTIAGGTFAITNIEPAWKTSEQGTMAAFEVDNLEATLDDLRAKGVPIVMDIYETPGCRMAIIADPDDNRLIIHHRK